jgi:hypothetical protein
MILRKPLTLATLAVMTWALVSAANVGATEKTGHLAWHTHDLNLSKSVPNQLNYQGYLAEAGESEGLTTTLQMTFRLYDDETSGTELWSETFPAVQISDGLFTVLLGSITPFPDDLFSGSPLWLQTEVGTEVLVPRKPLVSTAYGMRSQEADHAQTADWATYATDAQHAVTADTALYSPTTNVWTLVGNDVYRESGFVGIGVTNPAYTLDVAGIVNATTYYGDGSHLTGITRESDDDWTINGDDIYHVPGKVGIGTTDPAAKLHIEGGDFENALLAKGGWSYPILAEYDGSDSGAAICAKNTGDGGDALHAIAEGGGRSAIYARAAAGIDYAIWAEANGAGWAGYFSGDLHTSGKVGIGTENPAAKLDIEGLGSENALYAKGSWSYPIITEWGGSGEYAALLAKNTGTSGDAIQAVVEGSGRSAIYAKGASGADYAIWALANGATWAGFLSGDVHASGQVGIGTTVLGSHQLSVSSSGSGESGATAHIENDAADGIAMTLQNESSDITLLVSQYGAGDLIRCDRWAGGLETVFKVQNDGRIIGSILELTGGSDLAEPFDVAGASLDVKPGMLVCIDAQHPGELILSNKPYDRTVAGIISGAGGINPGMLMGQSGSAADGQYPVALTGRVYCRADASNGPIQPGDLLTSSNHR